MPGFLGFVELGSSLPLWFLTRNTSGVPTDPASLPTYRVYGSTGLVPNGTGSASQQDTGSITGATNASPIVITSANHGLTTGARVTITSVAGNTAANGTFTITAVSSSTFSLDGSAGGGAYTSGGAWHMTGLHGFTLAVGEADGYERGQTYSVLVEATVSGNAWAETFTFTVV